MTTVPVTRGNAFFRQRLGWLWLLVVAALSCVALCAVIWLPDLIVAASPGVSRGDRELTELFRLKFELRKLIAQVAVGVFGVIGLYLAVRRMLAMERQIDVQIQGQFADRFSKAIEHFAARSERGELILEKFFGGVAALQGIAEDSEQHRLRVLRQFAAYASGSLQDIGEFRGKPFLLNGLQVVSRMT
jgi:hypothetical protein